MEGSARDPRTARLYVRRGERTLAQRVFEPGPARCSELHAAVALATQDDLAAAPLPPQAERAARWAVSAAGLSAYRLLPKLAPGVALGLRRELAEPVWLRIGALCHRSTEPEAVTHRECTRARDTSP